MRKRGVLLACGDGGGAAAAGGGGGGCCCCSCCCCSCCLRTELLLALSLSLSHLFAAPPHTTKHLTGPRFSGCLVSAQERRREPSFSNKKAACLSKKTAAAVAFLFVRVFGEEIHCSESVGKQPAFPCGLTCDGPAGVLPQIARLRLRRSP